MLWKRWRVALRRARAALCQMIDVADVGIADSWRNREKVYPPL